MDIQKELEKIGIIPTRQLNIEERNYISKNIADKLATNVNELANSYNELYMRIFNCNMYYAKIDKKFKGVFYYYKNNTVYIDEEKDISEIDSYMIHENIHYLQNFNKIEKLDDRAGVCQFREFKIFGLGINEAIVQYITAKALGYKNHRINNEEISICTNSENHYKYMTSLIGQMMYLMGDKEAINSCIGSNDIFEEKLYNTFEENTERIVGNFDDILEENNREDRNEEKIIKLYMQTQELIYTTYFEKMYKTLNTTAEVDEQVDKMENYEQIIGKLLGTSVEEDNFIQFKKEMNSKYIKKYMEINKNKNKNSLMVVYKNVVAGLINKIAEFIQKKIMRT